MNNLLIFGGLGTTLLVIIIIVVVVVVVKNKSKAPAPANVSGPAPAGTPAPYIPPPGPIGSLKQAETTKNSEDEVKQKKIEDAKKLNAETENAAAAAAAAAKLARESAEKARLAKLAAEAAKKSLGMYPPPTPAPTPSPGRTPSPAGTPSPAVTPSPSPAVKPKPIVCIPATAETAKLDWCKISQESRDSLTLLFESQDDLLESVEKANIQNIKSTYALFNLYQSTQLTLYNTVEVSRGYVESDAKSYKTNLKLMLPLCDPLDQDIINKYIKDKMQILKNMVNDVNTLTEISKERDTLKARYAAAPIKLASDNAEIDRLIAERDKERKRRDEDANRYRQYHHLDNNKKEFDNYVSNRDRDREELTRKFKDENRQIWNSIKDVLVRLGQIENTYNNIIPTYNVDIKKIRDDLIELNGSYTEQPPSATSAGFGLAYCTSKQGTGCNRNIYGNDITLGYLNEAITKALNVTNRLIDINTDITTMETVDKTLDKLGAELLGYDSNSLIEAGVSKTQINNIITNNITKNENNSFNSSKHLLQLARAERTRAITETTGYQTTSLKTLYVLVIVTLGNYVKFHDTFTVGGSHDFGVVKTNYDTYYKSIKDDLSPIDSAFNVAVAQAQAEAAAKQEAEYAAARKGRIDPYNPDIPTDEIMRNTFKGDEWAALAAAMNATAPMFNHYYPGLGTGQFLNEPSAATIASKPEIIEAGRTNFNIHLDTSFDPSVRNPDNTKNPMNHTFIDLRQFPAYRNNNPALFDPSGHFSVPAINHYKTVPSLLNADRTINKTALKAYVTANPFLFTRNGRYNDFAVGKIRQYYPQLFVDNKFNPSDPAFTSAVGSLPTLFPESNKYHYKDT